MVAAVVVVVVTEDCGCRPQQCHWGISPAFDRQWTSLKTSTTIFSSSTTLSNQQLRVTVDVAFSFVFLCGLLLFLFVEDFCATHAYVLYFAGVLLGKIIM